MNNTNKMHYAWYILFCVCAIYGAGIGMIGNSAGLFLLVVSKDMGWQSASLNFYLTIVQIVMMVLLPFAGRLYTRVNVRIILSAGITLMAVAYVGSAFTHYLWQWYVIGVLLGIAYAFILYLPGPLLINNWFDKRAGLALGISMAFASITAAVVNPLGGWIIDQYGWRMARILIGSSAWLLAIPFCLFVAKYKPEDLGLKPYGYDNFKKAGAVSVIKGVFYKDALKNPAFYLTFCLAGIIVFCATMHMMTPSYANSIGLSSATGATAVSVIMIGGVVGKFFLGWLVDRIGARNTTFFAMLLGAMGAAVVLIGNTNVTVFFTGAFMFGFSYAALTIVPPLVVRAVYGPLDYEKIYSSVTIAFGLFGASAPLVYGHIYDVTKSYRGAWGFVLGFYLIAFFLTIFIFMFSKKLTWKEKIVTSNN
ncbi:MAG: MFS transporter [Deferribacterales bacterium]